LIAPSRPRVKQSSSLKLLSPDEQTVPVFDADCQYVYRTASRVGLVENAEAVVWSEAKLPVCPEGHRPLQGLPVAGFHLGLEEQLSLDFGLDQGVVLGFDGPQVPLHFVGVHQREWGFLRHDHNYGRNELPRQSSYVPLRLTHPASLCDNPRSRV